MEIAGNFCGNYRVTATVEISLRAIPAGMYVEFSQRTALLTSCRFQFLLNLPNYPTSISMTR